eukprot:TRINITY_DN969_c0_g3_i1.p1 TRINITY_DN969_c0_g3~~TRINITY_DN969_c0_g3_i1.p1  ORF type:complete len:559 (+),score=92.46 TRINITY_DN969_c0_g3_i1:62-1738(+)
MEHRSQQSGKSQFIAFVGNLPFSTTENDLRRFFEVKCRILNIRIPLEFKTKRPKGFAYVEFRDAQSLNEAIKLNGQIVQGRRIRVNVEANERYGAQGSAKDQTARSTKSSNPKPQESQPLICGYRIPTDVVDIIVRWLRLVGTSEDLLSLRLVSSFFKKRLQKQLMQVIHFDVSLATAEARRYLKKLCDQKFCGGLVISRIADLFDSPSVVLPSGITAFEGIAERSNPLLFSMHSWNFIPTNLQALTWPFISDKDLEAICKRTNHSLTKLVALFGKSVTDAGLQSLSTNLRHLSLGQNFSLTKALPCPNLTALDVGIVDNVQVLPANIRALSVSYLNAGLLGWQHLTQLEEFGFDNVSVPTAIGRPTTELWPLLSKLPRSVTSLKSLSIEKSKSYVLHQAPFPVNLRHLTTQSSDGLILPNGLESLEIILDSVGNSFDSIKGQIPDTLTRLKVQTNKYPQTQIFEIPRSVKCLHLESYDFESFTSVAKRIYPRLPRGVEKLITTRFFVTLAELRSVPAHVKNVEIRLCQLNLSKADRASLRKDLVVTIRQPLEDFLAT